MNAAAKKGVSRVLIMAGGTGGHVFPALAVAEQLRDRGVDVVWLGTRRGLESRVVPRASFEIAYVSISGLRGKGVLRWLWAPFGLLLALAQSLLIVVRRRPGAVLGMGGFVTGPGGVASWLLRKPLLIHEQNAIAGLTNRYLAHLAAKVMEAFPGTFPARYRAVCTGNPVRAAIRQIAEPDERFAGRSGALRVLVMGGSQGAQVLNDVVPQAARLLPAALVPEVWHQTGSRDWDVTRQRYADNELQARVEPFIDDMAAAYAWADLVVCRAGALTIAELAAAGVAAVLVPYPYAVDDHQTVNARFLVQAGAAVLMPQAQLTEQTLSDLINGLSVARHRVLDMARAARALASPDADRRVAALCMEALQA